jgi:hypothetical protein
MKTQKIEPTHVPAGPFCPWSPGMKPPKQPDEFIIEVMGCMTEDWSSWFNGLNVQYNEEKGSSIIYGSVKDQAELFSVLIKIRNLGLSLLRLNGNA